MRFLPFYLAKWQKNRKFALDLCGSSSVGRALASQAKGRGFEPRLPLFSNPINTIQNEKKHCCRQLENEHHCS